MNTVYDVAVVGAGFGGLGAALRLVEGGARVVLLEALTYPGGCAATFSRHGHRFEAGATLFAGFSEGQVFRRWIDRHGLDVELDWIDPVVELRTPAWSLPVTRRREELLAWFAARPGAPVEGLRRLFDLQRRVADLLWEPLDDPSLLPPFRGRALWRHLVRLPRYAMLLPLVGRPLTTLLDRFGLASFEPLVTYLDALCRITIQCGVHEAETLFALGTMDYYWRGAAHVRGGIGRLGAALVEAIRAAGGDVVFANRVQRLEARHGGWRVHARRGPLDARAIVANVLPHVMRDLLGIREGTHRGLDRLARRVEGGWGACMLYLAADPPPGAPEHAHHLELVADPSKPLLEGNHCFVSISGEHDGERAPGGRRTLTVSTHVFPDRLKDAPADAQAAYVAGVQDTMRATLRARAPEWAERVRTEMPASPRTFRRFTGRPWGYVGGIPRRAGWANYRDLVNGPVLEGLHLVGDTVFPGQSTLATAVGGIKAAERVLRGLRA